MEKIKNYIIIILAITLGVMIYLNTRPEIVDDVVVIIPPSSGTSGDVVPEERDSLPPVVEEIVYIKETKIVVDSTYKAAYEQAIKEKDSVEARNLFLEAIEIKEYNEVAIDNDTIKVDLYAKTRGQLLAYRVDYNIKEQTFTYTPEVVHVRPRLTGLIGVEAIFPSNGRIGDPGIKIDLGFQGKKGNVISVGADTRKNVYIGYKKSFTLFK
jgi:hypothetical protein